MGRFSDFSILVGAIASHALYAQVGLNGRLEPIPVNGVVLSAEGKAISGARVRAIRVAPQRMTTSVVTSGSDGKFELPLPDDGDYVFCATVVARLTAAAPQVDPCYWLDAGLPAVRIRRSPARPASVTVRMLEGRRVGVLIRDPERSLPPQANEHAQNNANARTLTVHVAGPPNSHPRPLVATRPDGDGQRFDLVLPAAQPARLRVHARGVVLRDASNRVVPNGRLDAPISLPEKGGRAEIVLTVGKN